MNICYKKYEPSALAKPFIDCFWTCHTDGDTAALCPTQKCFPSGMLELVIQIKGPFGYLNMDKGLIHYPQTAIFGMRDKATEWAMYGTSELMGIHFTPEGVFQLFGVPVAELYNQHLDIETFIGKKIRPVIEQIIEAPVMKTRMKLLEDFVCQQAYQAKLQDNYFCAALTLMRNNSVQNISVLCDTVFICERQLQRTFKSILGITPKHYLRLLRLNHVHERAIRGVSSYSSVAYEMGYSDPAHLTREFKAFFWISAFGLLYGNSTICFFNCLYRLEKPCWEGFSI